MICIKRKYLSLLTLLSLLLSCETEIDISYEGEILPVVFGVVERDIKPYRPGVNEYQSVYTNYIRIGKTFSAKYRPDLTAKIVDSLYFKEAKVKLEYCFMGQVVSETILEKTTEIIKDKGFFSDDSNILYKTVPHIFPARMDTIRLVIELPYRDKLVTSASAKRAPPQLFSPKWRLMPGREIAFYKRGGFEILWYDWGGYYELIMKVNYTNHYSSGEQEDKAVNYRKSFISTREKEWDYMNWYEIMDGNPFNQGWSIFSNGSIISKMTYSPDHFYNFIGKNIEEDPNIESRTFKHIEFCIFNADKKYYDYIYYSDAKIDQRMKFTNIENGLGFFTTISRLVKNNVYLKRQSMDSLARGQFTKHLKFMID
ncbi:hypothetical protein ACFLTI_00885 [Bacteroidota bacterium]